MSWLPDPIVTIGGVDYTGDVLAGVNVTYGRPEVYAQPQASYCRLTLIAGPDGYPLEVTEPVTVTVADSLGDRVRLFTGRLSDIRSTVEASGTFGTVLAYELVAVGPLAILSRSLAGGDGFPSELEGDRIARILSEGFSPTWEELDPTLRWSDVDPTVTWETFGADFIGDIDTPGVYALAELDPTSSTALQLAGSAALDGSGILFETPDGKVNYADSTRRALDARTAGFLTIPATDALTDGIDAVVREADLVNRALVQYAGGQVQADNPASRTLYGTRAFSYATQLADEFAALQRAERIVGLDGLPRPILEDLRLAVHTLDAGLRDALLDVRAGLPVRIRDLPAGIIPSNPWAGFVEGWTWSIGRVELFLDLSVSDYGLSVFTTRWLDVDPTLTWADVDPTLTWATAEEVTA
jgi:hypothetical protein